VIPEKEIFEGLVEVEKSFLKESTCILKGT
jgi:hypothetical protein